jgi:hypothetical protein
MNRRNLLQALSMAGTVLPFTAAAARAAPTAARENQPSNWQDELEAVIAKAKSAELVAFKKFKISGRDLPWLDLGISATPGQQVTFLLDGRMWLSRDYDLWFEPGVVFHARTRGASQIFNPMSNTGTMTASMAGPIEIARSAGEWADETGRLWTPETDYQKADVEISGIALVWRNDAARGLRTLFAHGNPSNMLQVEISRLESGRKLPDGWTNLFMFGGGPVIFTADATGEIHCRTQKNVGILQHSVSVPLRPGTNLNWRWLVEALPSALPEDQPATHDYLSIAVEFDDGQDLTYMWSQGLDAGKAFRCPLARWSEIETHLVVRSGPRELGKWLNESRDIHADYKAHIGGKATAVVRVWLLGVSVFQRREGVCRFADINLTGPEGAVHKL